MMREDPNISNSTQEWVNSTWHRINCNTDLACEVAGVTPPDVCPNQGEGEVGGGGGGVEGGGGGGGGGGRGGGGSGGSSTGGLTGGLTGGSIGGSTGGTAGGSSGSNIGSGVESALGTGLSKGTRKKRQTSGGRRRDGSGGSLGSGAPGPGGAPAGPDSGPEGAAGPHPPTPNADANAYAEFLVKYMALDDDTRRNIGHKVLHTANNYTPLSSYNIKEDQNTSKLTATTLLHDGAWSFVNLLCIIST